MDDDIGDVDPHDQSLGELLRASKDENLLDDYAIQGDTVSLKQGSVEVDVPREKALSYVRLVVLAHQGAIES